MKKLLKYFDGYKKYLFLGPFFKLLEAIFELIVPLVTAKIIDIGIANGNRDYIIKMSIIIILLGLSGLAFALTCQYFAAKCAYGFGTKLRAALYRHINSLSRTETDRLGTSTLTTRLINDTNAVQTGINMGIRLATRVPFLIIGAIIMALSLDIKLSLIFLVTAPLIAFIIYKIMSRSIPMFSANQKRLDRISMLTGENLEGVRVIRAFSRQKEETEKFCNASNEFSRHAVMVGKISSVLNPVTFMIMNLSAALIIWAGGYRVNSGGLTQAAAFRRPQGGSPVADDPAVLIDQVIHIPAAQYSHLSLLLQTGISFSICTGWRESAGERAKNIFPVADFYVDIPPAP